MVYVKANGRVPCWCDTGETHTITYKPNFKDVDFIKDIVNGPDMINMRKRILLDNKYYINSCNTCAMIVDEEHNNHFRYEDKPTNDSYYIDANEAITALNKVHKYRGWEYGSIDYIREIQLESSFVCSLKCPGCIQGLLEHPLITEEKPYYFDLSWFKHMIESIKKHNILLKKLVFVGKGEPTLNKHLHTMIKYVKLSLPQTFLSMDTNANQDFKIEYLMMNNINCSIDGMDNDSYSIYRKGGDFNKAINFMKEAKKATHKVDSTMKFNTKSNITWKYILFDGNDNIDQLNEAQKIAKSLDINKLRFIITNSPSPSKKYTNIGELIDYIQNNRIFLRTTCGYAT